MAKSPGVINGSDFLLYIDASHPIGLSTSGSVALTSDMRDISNKDTVGWAAYLPGIKKWTASCEALTAFDKTYNYFYLMNLQIQKTLISFSLKTSNADNEVISGTVYINSIQLNAPNEQNTTFSISFQGTGQLTAVAPGGGLPMGKGIAALATDTTVNSDYDLYIVTSSGAVHLTIDAIANIANFFEIQSQGTGLVTITVTNGLLIAGVATIYLATGQYIKIYPNVTKFEATGTFLTAEP